VIGVPVCALFCASIVSLTKERTVYRFLRLLGATCLVMLVLTLVVTAHLVQAWARERELAFRLAVAPVSLAWGLGLEQAPEQGDLKFRRTRSSRGARCIRYEPRTTTDQCGNRMDRSDCIQQATMSRRLLGCIS
jgi:hypothetical protein